jgi:hypothetical protein
MTELIETRWRKFGNDRVYVRTADGTEVGVVDLKNGCVAQVAPGYEVLVNDCLVRWSSNAVQVAPERKPVHAAPPSHPAMPVLPPFEDGPSPPRPAVASAPPPSPAVSQPETPSVQPKDLAANKAGAKARAQRDAVNAKAPVLNFVGRVLGAKTDERAWRVGYRGEEMVGKQLDKLGPRWHVLHAVEVGTRGSDIDHVVIGPAGVFTLNTKRHPNGRASVSAHSIYVNGHRTDYLRNSRHEGDRAARLLTAACGFPVPVQPVVVFVNLEDLKVKATPANGVEVTWRKGVVDWLTSRPTVLADSTVEKIWEKARLSTTWTD